MTAIRKVIGSFCFYATIVFFMLLLVRAYFSCRIARSKNNKHIFMLYHKRSNDSYIFDVRCEKQ
jgi:hypothetical protein